jgi:hypothetical protein
MPHVGSRVGDVDSAAGSLPTVRFTMATILALVLLCAGTADAHSSARVSGRVLDQTGAPLPGVAIELVVNSREWTATTDETGLYRFESIPPGDAELTYRLINFGVLRRSIVVADDAPASADVVLTLSLRADVIVTGTSTFRSVAEVEDPESSLVGSRRPPARAPSPRRNWTLAR